jgi:hypothetical protein
MGEQGTGIAGVKTWYSEDKRKPKHQGRYTRSWVRKVKKRNEIL